jgi:hypothetical protein
MAEHLRHQERVHPPLEHVGRRRMAEQVRVDSAADAGPLAEVADELLNTALRDRL